MSVDTPEDLDGLRRAGRAVSATLREVAPRARPGVTTADLDALAARVLARHGARSAPALVYGFPGAICIRVDDEAVQGGPGPRRLRAGGRAAPGPPGARGRAAPSRPAPPPSSTATTPTRRSAWPSAPPRRGSRASPPPRRPR